MAADLDKKLLQVSKFIQKGQLERAVKEYQKLATLHKRDPKILNSLGDTYIKLKQVDNALEVFNDVADKYIKDGFYPNAIAIYRKMLRFKPDEIDVKLKLADLYVKVGMFSDAEFYYNQFADHFVHRGEIIKAIPAFEKICSINPENIELRKTLAELYFRVENIDKMFAMYKEVFDYLMSKKDNEGLADVFNTVTAISNKNNLLTNPTYFTIFEEYITYLYRMNQGSLAKKSAMDMAGIYLELGNPRWAQALYNKVLELDPGEMSARIKLIELYKKQGESSLLVQEYLNMAEYLKESDPARAKVIYSEVLQLDPENIEARTALHGEEKAALPKKEAPPPEKPSPKEEKAPSMVESPDVESHVYGEEETGEEIDISLGDVTVSTGEEFKDKLKSVDLGEGEEEEEPEISVEIESEETEEAAVKTTEEEAPAVEEKKGFFDDDEEMNIEFEVEVGAGGNMEVKEKPPQKENLETALADIFSQYSEKLGDQQSLLSNINDLDSEEFIPSVDEIVNTFKKGLEEQLGGDPQAHYDMGIAYKEMGLYDSAIGEFRKLSLLPQYRFKSLNLLAQTLVERGDYQEAVEEFLEVLGDENLTEEEKDGVLYNIVVAYYRGERYPEAFEYYNRISSHQIFKKDELFNEIRKKFHSLFPEEAGDEEEARAPDNGTDWGDDATLSIEHEESPFADVTVEEEEKEHAPGETPEISFSGEGESEPAYAPPAAVEHLLSEIEELKDSVATNEDLIKDNSELITLLLQSREETQQLKNGWEALEERIRRLERWDEKLEALEKRMDALEESRESGEGDDVITLEEKRLLVRDLKNFKEETMAPAFREALDFIRNLSREGEQGLLHRIKDETTSLKGTLTEAEQKKDKAQKEEAPSEEAQEPLIRQEEEELLPGPGELLEPPSGEENTEEEEKDDDDKISYF